MSGREIIKKASAKKWKECEGSSAIYRNSNAGVWDCYNTAN